MQPTNLQPLIPLGVCLVVFPFVMVAAEVIFIDTASKLGIPRQKYPRLVVFAFRFFNGHRRSVGTAITVTGFALALLGVYQGVICAKLSRSARE